jgi:spore coat polysaccharide biosynthesis protein SpsF (cytidylyltransferase family)
MNKEEAINILLQHAIDSCEKIKIRKHSGHTEEVDDNLIKAIAVFKKDAIVEVTGLQVNSHKGA